MWYSDGILSANAILKGVCNSWDRTVFLTEKQKVSDHRNNMKNKNSLTFSKQKQTSKNGLKVYTDCSEHVHISCKSKHSFLCWLFFPLAWILSQWLPALLWCPAKSLLGYHSYSRVSPHRVACVTGFMWSDLDGFNKVHFYLVAHVASLAVDVVVRLGK